MKRITLAVCLALVASALPVAAAPNASEARGTITDQDGNPLQGIELVFFPRGNPATEYKAKTNKKGKYWVEGLFNPQEDGQWKVRVEAEGMVPIEMTLESRTVNRVLIGDIATKKLQPGADIPQVTIRPLGNARIDFVLAPEEQALEVLRAQQAAAGEEVEGSKVTQQQPQKDPWDEALVLAADGDFESSLPLFEKAIEDEPASAERRTAFAKVLYQLEEWADAAAAAREAIELDPGNVETRILLYQAYKAMGDNEQATLALEEAQAATPDDTRIGKQIAFIAIEEGRTADAIAAYESVTAVDPDDVEAWMSLGSLYAEVQQFDKSEQAYQNVIELNPSEAHQVFYNLGALTMRKGDRSDADTKRAVDAFRKAVDIKPDYAQAYRELALALLGTGDRGGAKTALESYVKYAPNASDAPQMQRLIETLSQ